MKKKAQLVVWAVLISFLGSLPLGTLNLGVARYSFLHQFSEAVSFSVAAIAVEIMLVRIALIAVRKLETLKHFHTLFRLLAGIVLMTIALKTLAATQQSMQQFIVVLPFAGLPPFMSGMLLSLINPLHLPFWIGWSTVLKSRKLLEDRPAAYNLFVASIGVGTALAFAAYGAAGRYLIGQLGQQQVWLCRIIGFTLMVTALLLWYRIFVKWKKHYRFFRKPITSKTSSLLLIGLCLIIFSVDGQSIAKESGTGYNGNASTGFAVIEFSLTIYI